MIRQFSVTLGCRALRKYNVAVRSCFQLKHVPTVVMPTINWANLSENSINIHYYEPFGLGRFATDRCNAPQVNGRFTALLLTLSTM